MLLETTTGSFLFAFNHIVELLDQCLDLISDVSLDRIERHSHTERLVALRVDHLVKTAMDLLAESYLPLHVLPPHNLC